MAPRPNGHPIPHRVHHHLVGPQHQVIIRTVVSPQVGMHLVNLTHHFRHLLVNQPAFISTHIRFNRVRRRQYLSSQRILTINLTPVGQGTNTRFQVNRNHHISRATTVTRPNSTSLTNTHIVLRRPLSNNRRIIRRFFQISNRLRLTTLIIVTKVTTRQNRTVKNRNSRANLNRTPHSIFSVQIRTAIFVRRRRHQRLTHNLHQTRPVATRLPITLKQQVNSMFNSSLQINRHSLLNRHMVKIRHDRRNKHNRTTRNRRHHTIRGLATISLTIRMVIMRFRRLKNRIFYNRATR